MTEAKEEGYKTIPLRPHTWGRLQDYKIGDTTYDEVINELMDAVPIERVAARLVREHRARLRNFRGRPWREMKRDLGD